MVSAGVWQSVTGARMLVTAAGEVGAASIADPSRPDGTSVLHLVNLSGLFEIDPDEFIDEWRGLILAGDTADVGSKTTSPFPSIKNVQRS